MTSPPQGRLRLTATWALASTLLCEAITIAARLATGTSAAEFCRGNPPLLLQVHHMFWSLPLVAVVPLVWRHRRLSSGLLGVSFGLVASDVLHHFLVLPLTVGNTGWHWP